MPSYFKVFPQSLGGAKGFRGSRGDPADHIFDLLVNIDGRPQQVHVEVLFRAVNDLDIEEFFRGFEFTAIWLPEADTNGDLAALLSLGSNRVGRYPEPEDRPLDGEPAYMGIFGDANAPIIGTPFHTRFYLRADQGGGPAPPSDRLFRQPSGFSPNAENMVNLRRIRRDYYDHMASQLDDYDIGRMIRNKEGYGRHGQPVHPNFDHDTHVATRDIEVDPYAPVFVGVDAGSGSLIPGATFNQRTAGGQWRTLDEIYLADGQMTLMELGADIRRRLNSRFGALKAGVGAMICGDPALQSRSSVNFYTEGAILQDAAGIELNLAPTNEPKLRRAAMDRQFKRMVGPREPGKLIDPACIGLIQGYAGGFHYPKRGAVVSLLPAKNRFSHVCEADEYAPLTAEGLDAGEGRFIRLDGESEQHQLRTLLED